MQPHQYALAAGILWLATLTVLPFLIAKARRRAYDEGFAEHQRQSNSYIAALNKDISQLAVARQEDQRKHDLTVANLKRTISELEERIMSYTGLAVTRADYDLLSEAMETLRLAERTWKPMAGTAPTCVRAAAQIYGVEALAKRIHAQLRCTPATAVSTEVAA
ncbi:MAG: hypothetical protein ACLGJA_11060 [Gammaproteobacteria bacterium]|jgi:hypothetical protein